MSIMRSRVFQRSRFGCQNCKKSKVKCDESKPSCTRCSRRGIDCEYQVPLHWLNNLNQNIETPATSLSINSTQTPINTTEFTFINSFINKLELRKIFLKNFDKNLKSSGIQALFPSNVNHIDTDSLSDPINLEPFEFYCKFTAHLIVVAPSSLFEDNPFYKIIPQYALKSSSLMSIVVAFAMVHKSFILDKVSYSQDQIDELFSMAEKELSVDDKNDDISEEDQNIKILIGLMITSFQIFTSTKHVNYLYFNQSKKIFLDKYFKRPQTEILMEGTFSLHEFINDPLNFFVIRWMGYLDVIVPLMSKEETMDALRATKLTPLWQYLTTVSLTNSNEVDMILGFNVKFLFLFDELIDIVEDSNRFESNKDDVFIKAHFWKSKMYYFFENSFNKEIDNNNTELHETLYYSNMLFYHACLIILYSRALKMARNLTVIQESCRIIKEICENHIEPGSCAESCSIFSIFTAGCEAIDEDLRIFFEDRLKSVVYSGNHNALAGLNVFKTTWETGKPWTEIVAEMDDDFFL